MQEFKKTVENKMKAMEQRNVYLEKCNSALEERVNDLEKLEKEKNIEIAGLMKNKDEENVKEVVKEVALKLCLNPEDIESAERLGSSNKPKTGVERPRPIVVKLRSKQARDQWLQKRKTKLYNGDIYRNDNRMPIYINEDLTKTTKLLFWEARSQLKHHFKFIWIQNSHILVKKDEKEKIIRIKSENDIKELLSDNKKVNIKSQEVSIYKIPGYTVYPNTRDIRRGGGILIYVKEDLQFTTEVPQTQLKATELTYGKLRKGNMTTHILALYRPPHTNKLLFVTELEALLKTIPAKEELVLIGDINIDLAQDANTSLTAYKIALCESGLQSAIPVKETTREAIVDGRLNSSNIDHVCVRASRGQPIDARAYLLTCTLSDHYMVGISLAPSGNVSK
ncbi:hypothetical protein SFRURICE_020890, partial [Spodoptera frugiperda]